MNKGSQRIFIAGATGFVGLALIRALSKMENTEAVAGIHNTENIANLGVKTVFVDVARRSGLDRTLAQIRPDVVINAAAYGVHPDQQDSECAVSVNIAGAMYLLEAATVAGCRRFVQLGSCSEYGAREGLVSENMASIPNTLYGATKAAATILVQEHGTSLGVETLILRLFNIWGENEPEHRIFPSVVASCREERPIQLTDGEQLKDYSYIGDIAAWIISLALLPGKLDVGIVNIASGQSRPLRDFIIRIAESFGKVELMHFGEKINRIHEARGQIPDLGKLESLLPDRKITSLEVALDRVLGSNHLRKPGPL